VQTSLGQPCVQRFHKSRTAAAVPTQRTSLVDRMEHVAKAVLSDLSIIIVNWNTKALLRQCLESIYTSADGLVFDVYVVDNGSTDGSAAMVESDFPGVTVLINEKNEGFAKANNQALCVASGRYVVLLNSDTVVQPDALNKMVAFLDTRGDVASAGCKLLSERGEVQLSAAWFPSIFTPLVGGIVLPRLFARVFGVKRFPGQIYLLPESHEEIQEVDWVCGACLMVRRSVLEDIGLLDENLFMYGEEIDWCFRIRKKGWKVCYFPESEVMHLHGGSALRPAVKTLAIQRRVFAERYIIRKHHGRCAAILYELLMFAAALLKLPVWWWLKVLRPSSNLASNRLAMHRVVIFSILGNRNSWPRS
jgi:GT2 family glycosyltransferase